MDVDKMKKNDEKKECLKKIENKTKFKKKKTRAEERRFKLVDFLP